MHSPTSKRQEQEASDKPTLPPAPAYHRPTTAN